VADDLVAVNHLSVTDHDLALSHDTIYEQHERLGWGGKKIPPRENERRSLMGRW